MTLRETLVASTPTVRPPAPFHFGSWTLGGSVAKQAAIEMEGIVTEVLPGQKFRVRVQNDHMVLAYAAGKMSKFHIRVLVGDTVTLELSPYDLTRGRITFRHKVAGGPLPPSKPRRRN